MRSLFSCDRILFVISHKWPLNGRVHIYSPSHCYDGIVMYNTTLITQACNNRIELNSVRKKKLFPNYPFYVSHEEELARRAWWDSRLLSGGLNTVPQLASCREDGCSGEFQANVWKQRTVCHVERRLAFVSPRLFLRFFLDSRRIKHGVSNTPDPEAGGLGFNHRRMVLRPPSKYICQCFTPIHLAVSSLFPLHTLHGKYIYFEIQS